MIRARVTSVSRLVGTTAADIDFREKYKAAIVTMQRGGKNLNESLSTVVFEAGDTLILQASEDSPLLCVKPPTDDFYKRIEEEVKSATPKVSRPNSYVNLVNLVKIPNLVRKPSKDNLASNAESTAAPATSPSAQSNISRPSTPADDGDGFYIPGDESSNRDSEAGIEVSPEMVSVSHSRGAWHVNAPNAQSMVCYSVMQKLSDGLEKELILRDLEVNLSGTKDGGNAQPSREFLAAMEVEKNSQLAGQTVAQSGVIKLPGVVLISIERPIEANEVKRSIRFASISAGSSIGDDGDGTLSLRTSEPTYTTIELDQPLQDGDVLWFAGSASAVGDLRKIPGLISFESEEVKKVGIHQSPGRLASGFMTHLDHSLPRSFAR